MAPGPMPNVDTMLSTVTASGYLADFVLILLWLSLDAARWGWREMIHGLAQDLRSAACVAAVWFLAVSLVDPEWLAHWIADSEHISVVGRVMSFGLAASMIFRALSLCSALLLWAVDHGGRMVDRILSRYAPRSEPM